MFKVYKCKECNFETNKPHSLGAHVTTKHRPRPKLKRIKVTKNCKVCSKKFKVERTISKLGIENIHKKEKQCCSSKCSNSIGGNSVFGTKNVKCSKCFKTYEVDKRGKIKHLLCDSCKIIYKCKKKKVIKIYKKREKKIRIRFSVIRTLICKICSVSFLGKHAKYCDLCRIERFKLAGRNSASKRVLRSKNEIYFYELCKTHFKNVRHNEPIFNGWDADVIIEDLKTAILWNGKWHYEKITEKHSVIQVQNRDKIKISEIKKAGYIPYIIKDVGKNKKSFVESEFQKFIKTLK